MASFSHKILIIFDDREFTSYEVQNFVGLRRFGDIIFKRRTLIEYFQASLPEWARKCLIHLRAMEDLPILRNMLKSCDENCAICIVASCTGFMDSNQLYKFIEYLPCAETDFTDRLYNPLLVFIRNSHQLLKQWSDFENAPLHKWDLPWQGLTRIQNLQVLDLTKASDFLSFMGGSTEMRYFNHVQIDDYYYIKSSKDKSKIIAEYSFYDLAPKWVQTWLVQPFDYQDHGHYASYKMLRYYLADVALQWVHGAFNEKTFEAFIKRLFFFLTRRPRKTCPKSDSALQARAFFVTKLEARISQFLQLDKGKSINILATNMMPCLDLNQQLKRYLYLYAQYEKYFSLDYMVVGHGDLCFSNILYDQQRHLLKLIDPKGAMNQQELWGHPLYDLCKLSHSALGDYDFINHCSYTMTFKDNNDLELSLKNMNCPLLKTIFQRHLHTLEQNEQIIRLGEASLFLSMLPLHIDHPNKILAFMLKAKHILDEVENE